MILDLARFVESERPHWADLAKSEGELHTYPEWSVSRDYACIGEIRLIRFYDEVKQRQLL
jgi:hypothetical protein